METYLEMSIPDRIYSTYKKREWQKMAHTGSVENCQKPGVESQGAKSLS